MLGTKSIQKTIQKKAIFCLFLKSLKAFKCIPKCKK